MDFAASTIYLAAALGVLAGALVLAAGVGVVAWAEHRRNNPPAPVDYTRAETLTNYAETAA